MADNLSSFIDELKEKNDIADVIGRYVTLIRNGGKFWGRCPFHHEKTPSFAVNTDGQYYHCFGCGASGDVIKFIREIESLEFMEAVKFLSEKSGMKLPDSFGREDESTAQLKKKRDTLYALLKEAARYYYSCLNESGGHIIKYLNGRGVQNEYIAKFGLGYSPDYNGLISRLKDKGYIEEDIKASGAAQEKNGRLYDPLGTRLIVPIINSSGDVIAFGGRDMEGTSGAKYKNTSETLLFNKSKNLYAINMVKKSKQEKGNDGIIVVEGYMDAIALHQAGFTGTVASMGTSLTKEQAKLIKRYSSEVFICYDGDSAGQTATLRGLDILKSAELNVRVISMPDGVDPDEYINEHGAEGFKDVISRAPPLSDFKLISLAGRYDLSSQDGKRKYIAQALSVIAQEENVTVKEELLKLLRTQTGITYESLKRDLENVKPQKEKAPINEQAMPPAESGTMEVKAARFILYCLLYRKGFAKDCAFIGEFLQNSAHIRIYSYIKDCNKNNIPVRVSSLFEGGGEDSPETAAVIECGETMTDEEQEKYYADCVNLFKTAAYEKELKILASEFEQETDLEKRKKLALKIQAVTAEQKKHLSKRL